MATAAATAWWVVVPPAEQTATKRPADAMVISTQVGSTFYNTLLNTDTGSVSVNGKSWVRFQGPFTTKSQAQSSVVGPITIGDWVAAGIAGASIGGIGATPAAAVGLGGAVGTGVDKAVSGWNLLVGGDLRKFTLRAAEVVIGGLLIIMALEEMMKSTGATNIVQAAKKYGKYAKFLA